MTDNDYALLEDNYKDAIAVIWLLLGRLGGSASFTQLDIITAEHQMVESTFSPVTGGYSYRAITAGLSKE